MNGSSKALEDVCTQLDIVSTSLDLVQHESRLHTTGVETQVTAITKIMEELKTFFDQLRRDQEKHKIRQFAHALNSGDREDKELVGILTRLSGARQELITRISVVHVGITGNLHDGFQVAQKVVMEINENVKRTLGIQLLIAERLQTRQLVTTEIVNLEEEDVNMLGLRTGGNERAAPELDSTNTSSDVNNLNWHNNKMGDEPRIMVGNVGLGELETAAVVKASIENSQFGKGAGFMVGTVGKEGAKSFNENFWKR